jgi:hypothetical protein
METPTQNEVLDEKIQALIRITERNATTRELNRVLGILIEWGYRLTPEQVQELVGLNQED